MCRLLAGRRVCRPVGRQFRSPCVSRRKHRRVLCSVPLQLYWSASSCALGLHLPCAAVASAHAPTPRPPVLPSFSRPQTAPTPPPSRPACWGSAVPPPFPGRGVGRRAHRCGHGSCGRLAGTVPHGEGPRCCAAASLRRDRRTASCVPGLSTLARESFLGGRRCEARLLTKCGHYLRERCQRKWWWDTRRGRRSHDAVGCGLRWEAHPTDLTKGQVV